MPKVLSRSVIADGLARILGHCLFVLLLPMILLASLIPGIDRMDRSRTSPKGRSKPT